MDWEIVHIDETASTNQWLREHAADGQELVVWADYQTAGRGCGSNTWESERGQNLTFSVLLHPLNIGRDAGAPQLLSNDAVAAPQRLPASRQFHISMVASLAVVEAVGQHIGDLSIKWPNDIYWRNGKLGGMLIENRLHGSVIRDSIVGIGLNVNQRTFHSDAPNPVSIWQVCEHETDRRQLLDDILGAMRRLLGSDVRSRYLSLLYRRQGFHPYADREGAFMAEFVDVEDDGHLLLRDDGGRERRYAFKEVQFI